MLKKSVFVKSLTVISQKRFKDPSQWQDTPWVDHERPSWFTFAPPLKESRNNPASFGFLSSNDMSDEGVFLSQPPIRANQYPQRRPPTQRPVPKSHVRPKTLPLLSLVSYKNNWLDKELFFAMNKLSIVGMVAGLMFLGALFFISGFLLALNLYVLPNHQTPVAAIADVNPHRASPNALSAAHRPTAKAPPPATVPQQYANVGGVTMMPPPHKPTQAPVQQQPQPMMRQVQPPPQQAPYQQQPVYQQQQPVYQSQPSAAPAPYPDARYAQQPVAPANNSYAQPQYAPAYAPTYQQAPQQ